MTSITRHSIAKNIFYETGIPTSIALKIVDSIFSELANRLVKDSAIKIHKFGSFKVKQKNARVGRNLNTGEEVVINARKVVSFIPSDQLKQAINEK